MSGTQSNPGGTQTAEPKRNGRGPRASVQTPGDRKARTLAEALLAVQAAAPKLRKDATGQVQNRTYGYATLDGVLDDIEPLLVEQELLFTAKAIIEDGQAVALYRMEHVPSSEHDEWTGPLPCSSPANPQALGSSITYMRRYTLIAYLNLAPGEDDDGQAASAGSAARPVPAPPSRSGEKLASEAQGKLIHVRAEKASLGPVQLADLILRVTGSEPRDWEGEGEATGWLERALKHLPAAKVDPVLHAIDQEAVAR